MTYWLANYRFPITLFLLSTTLILLFALELLLGVATLSPSEVITALSHFDQTSVANHVIWKLRLPRALIGIIVGIHFALSGLILQSVVRNPLADPTVLGISAGASLMVVISLMLEDLLGDVFHTYTTFQFSMPYLPFAAMLGGTATAFLVLGLSWRTGIHPGRMALYGVAIGAVLNAIVMGVVVGWGAGNAEVAILWLAGTLYGRDFSHFWIVLPWLIAGIGSLVFIISPLSMLRFDDDFSRSLGLRVRFWRVLTILVAVGLAASAISVTGPVGFVGLVTPHLARQLVGSDIRALMAVCSLCGAALMLAADLIGRQIAVPLELPVGAITTLIGVPLFLFLLYRQGWNLK